MKYNKEFLKPKISTMTFQSYFSKPAQSKEETISYEEQLLLHYDDCFEDGCAHNWTSHHPLYNIELGDLEI